MNNLGDDLWREVVRSHRADERGKFSNEFRGEMVNVIQSLRENAEYILCEESNAVLDVLGELTLLRKAAAEVEERLLGLSAFGREMLLMNDSKNILSDEIKNSLARCGFDADIGNGAIVTYALVERAAIPFLKEISAHGIQRIQGGRVKERRVQVKCVIADIVYNVNKLYARFVGRNIGRTAYYSGQSQVPEWLLMLVKSIVGGEVAVSALDRALRALRQCNENEGDASLDSDGSVDDIEAIGDASWLSLFRRLVASDKQRQKQEAKEQRCNRRQKLRQLIKEMRGDKRKKQEMKELRRNNLTKLRLLVKERRRGEYSDGDSVLFDGDVGFKQTNLCLHQLGEAEGDDAYTLPLRLVTHQCTSWMASAPPDSHCVEILYDMATHAQVVGSMRVDLKRDALVGTLSFERGDGLLIELQIVPRVLIETLLSMGEVAIICATEDGITAPQFLPVRCSRSPSPPDHAVMNLLK